jgi:phosphoglycolate phosphatase
VLGVVGLSLPEAFQVLAPEHDEPTRRALSDRYKGAFPRGEPSPFPRDPLFAGAKSAVEALARRDDIVLGIATGKSRRGVDRLLEQEGWHAHFRTIQTADEHPSKPHPSMIETAMRETGIAPNWSVIVGDTTFDIEMGRNAGIGTIGVGWGYHPVEALQSAGAHTIVEAFEGLEAALDRMLDDKERRR